MADQLGLFGEDSSAGTQAAVGSASVPPEILALAQRLPRHLFLGTSSWSFPGWRGILWRDAHPEAALAREGLAAYSRHPLLRTVGIDRSYYAAVPEVDYRRYAAQVPDGFRFVVKAPARVTDPLIRSESSGATAVNADFLDATIARLEWVEPVTRGLGPKLGVLVLQFPPLPRPHVREPAAFARRLAGFLEALPRGPVYAVELRNPELLVVQYVDALGACGARHCLSVHPRAAPLATQAGIVAALPAGALVARWNLHGGLAYESARARYAPFDRILDEDPLTRSTLAQLCARSLAGGQPAWVIANNKAEGSAPLTLFALARAIADRL